MSGSLSIIVFKRSPRPVATRFHAEKENPSAVGKKSIWLPSDLIRFFEIEIVEASAIGVHDGSFALADKKSRAGREAPGRHVERDEQPETAAAAEPSAAEVIKLRRFKRAVASTALRFNADSKRTAPGPAFRDRLGSRKTGVSQYRKRFLDSSPSP